MSCWASGGQSGRAPPIFRRSNFWRADESNDLSGDRWTCERNLRFGASIAAFALIQGLTGPVDENVGYTIGDSINTMDLDPHSVLATAVDSNIPQPLDAKKLVWLTETVTHAHG